MVTPKHVKDEEPVGADRTNRMNHHFHSEPLRVGTNIVSISAGGLLVSIIS